MRRISNYSYCHTLHRPQNVPTAYYTVSRDKKSAVCIFSLLSLPVCDFYHERVMSVRTFAIAVLSFYRTVVDGAFRAMELIIVAIIIII